MSANRSVLDLSKQKTRRKTEPNQSHSSTKAFRTLRITQRALTGGLLLRAARLRSKLDAALNKQRKQSKNSCGEICVHMTSSVLCLFFVLCLVWNANVVYFVLTVESPPRSQTMPHSPLFLRGPHSSIALLALPSGWWQVDGQPSQ